MFSVHRMLAIAEKEILHVTRDPRTLFLALVMPVLLLVLFGFGVSFELDHLPIAVLDRDHTHASRELTRRFFANDDFERGPAVHDTRSAEQLLVTGDVLGVLAIDRGFEESRVTGRPVALALWLDGSDPNSATQARSKAEQLIGMAMMTRPPTFEVRTFTRYNPGGSSPVFLVPGIAGYVLSIIAVLLTSLTVAREWELGSMAQLFATPATRLEIVFGKLAPYLVLSFIAVLLVIASGVWIFDVPFRGSPVLLAAFSAIFLIATLGQGLLISVITRNQMVATQLATLMSVLPSLLLSGFLFPIENMPAPLRALSHLVPTRWFISALRGVLLRDAGVTELWPQALALALFSVAVIALSTQRFRRTIA